MRRRNLPVEINEIIRDGIPGANLAAAQYERMVKELDRTRRSIEHGTSAKLKKLHDSMKKLVEDRETLAEHALNIADTLMYARKNPISFANQCLAGAKAAEKEAERIMSEEDASKEE